MSTPTSRTLEHFRSLGFTVQVVERWNPYARIRQDLFNVIDIIAAGEAGLFGIQACAGSSHAARRTKALAEPKLRTWLEAGGRFEVVSWSKRVQEGKKRKAWACRREEIVLRGEELVVRFRE
jgi:hypothetical protein